MLLKNHLQNYRGLFLLFKCIIKDDKNKKLLKYYKILYMFFVSYIIYNRYLLY